MKQLYLLFCLVFLGSFLNAQIINFPDPNFKNALVQHDPVIDLNNDGEIDQSEALQATALFVSIRNINDLSGIEFFTNITVLSCRNNNLTSLDLSANLALTELTCIFNNITSINFGTNTNYVILNIGDNLFNPINLNNMTNLVNLDIYSLGYTENEIDFSNFPNLEELYAGFNDFVNVDLSQNQELRVLHLNSNPLLETLNLKSGSAIDGMTNLGASTNLQYVCVDNIEQEINLLNNVTSSTPAEVNSYCTIGYGGDFYELTGTVTYDLDGNGCNVMDASNIPLKLDVDNDTYDEVAFTSTTGDYNLQLLEGQSAVTASLENPDYFNVSPNGLTLNFPTETSPFVQDFCITPNGIHNDLEIIIYSSGEPSPGFTSDYTIYYRNKGNTILSGDINLSFDNDFMTLVSANPAPVSQNGGNLTWSFNNLQPFESNLIDFSIQFNTPTDPNFPLNLDDLVSFQGSISSGSTDDTPGDNNFTLEQVVVNSFDPNDKRCLEGETIAPENVGEYVHYMIRFENNGTANAVNVIISDEIDETKFDISSLIPLHSSHSFTTRIQNGNGVEFIFENINLPFDDANNDGFVVFKIRTVDTLVLGDTFSNDASIYFDFNAPIITNDFVTTIAEDNLSISEFSNDSFIRIFPNPVNDGFHVTSKSSIDKIVIMDINGRVVQSISITGFRSEYNIDISSMTTGIYLIRVNIKNETYISKIVKN